MQLRLFAFTTGLLLLSVLPAISQVSRVEVRTSPAADPHSVTLTFTFAADGPVRLTAGAPYSGRESMEIVRTLASGTRLAERGWMMPRCTAIPAAESGRSGRHFRSFCLR
jgi:hypothetical protein